jgi:hypothetical protein
MPDLQPFSPLFPETPGSDANTPFLRDSSSDTRMLSSPRETRCESESTGPSSLKFFSRNPSIDDIAALLWSDSDPLLPLTTVGFEVATKKQDVSSQTTGHRRQLSPPETRQNSSIDFHPGRRSPFVSKRVSPPELLRRTSSLDSLGRADSTGLGSSPFRNLNICSPAFPPPAFAPPVGIPRTERNQRRKSAKRSSGARIVSPIVKSARNRKLPSKLAMLRPPQLKFAQPFSPNSPPAVCTVPAKRQRAGSAFSPAGTPK